MDLKEGRYMVIHVPAASFIEHIYKGFQVVNMRELRKHIDNIAVLGVIDLVDEMWSKKAVDWDILHFEHAINKFNLEEYNDV